MFNDSMPDIEEVYDRLDELQDTQKTLQTEENIDVFKIVSKIKVGFIISFLVCSICQHSPLSEQS
jgi:hypothetical protein